MYDIISLSPSPLPVLSPPSHLLIWPVVTNDILQKNVSEDLLTYAGYITRPEKGS